MGASGQLDLLFCFPEYSRATFRAPFLGGVHLSTANVFIGNVAVLLEASPMLVCPGDTALKHRCLLYSNATFNQWLLKFNEE